MIRIQHIAQHIVPLFVAGCLAFGSIGCQHMPWNKDKKDGGSSSSKSDGMSSRDDQAAKSAVARMGPSRAATTQPTANNVTGTVTFTQTGDSIRVSVNLTGLPANSTHGFHIHEKGDLSDPELLSAGAHFNPAGHKHGGPDSPLAHAGDLGNVTSDHNGNVNIEMTIRGVTLDTGPTSIIGKSVLLHAGVDDLKTDPSGNSGARISGGVIEAK